MRMGHMEGIELEWHGNETHGRDTKARTWVTWEWEVTWEWDTYSGWEWDTWILRLELEWHWDNTQAKMRVTWECDKGTLAGPWDGPHADRKCGLGPALRYYRAFYWQLFTGSTHRPLCAFLSPPHSPPHSHTATKLYWQINRLRAQMNLARLTLLLPE